MKEAALGFAIGSSLALAVSFFFSVLKYDLQFAEETSRHDVGGSGIIVANASPPDGLGSVPMQDRTSNYRFNKSGDNDLGGQSHLPGGSINWRSESLAGDVEGATPSLVVQAVIDRLSFLQQTAQANGNNAKALFKLMEAKDIFDGESVELSSIHSTEKEK